MHNESAAENWSREHLMTLCTAGNDDDSGRFKLRDMVCIRKWVHCGRNSSAAILRQAVGFSWCSVGTKRPKVFPLHHYMTSIRLKW